MCSRSWHRDRRHVSVHSNRWRGSRPPGHPEWNVRAYSYGSHMRSTTTKSTSLGSFHDRWGAPTLAIDDLHESVAEVLKARRAQQRTHFDAVLEGELSPRSTPVPGRPWTTRLIQMEPGQGEGAVPWAREITVRFKNKQQRAIAHFLRREYGTDLEGVVGRQVALAVVVRPGWTGLVADVERVDVLAKVGCYSQELYRQEAAFRAATVGRRRNTASPGWREALHRTARPRVVAIGPGDGSESYLDVKERLGGRKERVDLHMVHARVSGKGAVTSLCGALVEAQKQADVILLYRGGGSAADLWPFNCARVARTIARSSCPVLTAIGHTENRTLSDSASDQSFDVPRALSGAVSSESRDRSKSPVSSRMRHSELVTAQAVATSADVSRARALEAECKLELQKLQGEHRRLTYRLNCVDVENEVLRRAGETFLRHRLQTRVQRILAAVSGALLMVAVGLWWDGVTGDEALRTLAASGIVMLSLVAAVLSDRARRSRAESRWVILRAGLPDPDRGHTPFRTVARMVL